MQRFKLEDFIRGWFIGDFTPSIFRTQNFEVGVLHVANNPSTVVKTSWDIERHFPTDV